MHKDLNAVMLNSKYGVQLAYALFTVAYYNRNKMMAAKYKQRNEYPVKHYICNNQSVPSTSNERFGLVFANRTAALCVFLSSNGVVNTHIPDTFSELKLVSSTYAQF